jgi:hypothetical protein
MKALLALASFPLIHATALHAQALPAHCENADYRDQLRSIDGFQLASKIARPAVINRGLSFFASSPLPILRGVLASISHASGSQ